MKTQTRLAIVWFACIGISAFGGTPGKRLSESDSTLKAPEILQRKPVLIYYANDRNLVPGIDPVENRLSKFIRMWAEMADKKGASADFKKQASRVVQALEKDAAEFTLSVDQEFALLRDFFCQGRSPFNVGLVLIRNWGSISFVDTHFESVKKSLLRYEYCIPTAEGGPTSIRTRYLPREWDAKGISEIKEVLLSQPLSMRLIFDWFLSDVAKVFSPEEYRFAFYGKTRGTKSFFFEGPLTDSFNKKPPERVLPTVMKILSQVRALPEETTSTRVLASMVYDTIAELDPVPPDQPDSNQFLEKGSLLQSLTDLGGGNLLKSMHFSHFVLDSNFAAVELSPVQNAKDFLRTPPGYSKMMIDTVDYLHFRESVSGYHPFALEKLFPPGRPVGSDFMEHFGKHVESAAE